MVHIYQNFMEMELRKTITHELRRKSFDSANGKSRLKGKYMLFSILNF